MTQQIGYRMTYHQQNFIAYRMTVCIIDEFEIIYIHKNNAK